MRTITRFDEKVLLALRGGFHPSCADKVPLLADGRRAATLLLVGAVGQQMWPSFRASPDYGRRGDPLDAWTRRAVGGVAGGSGATALFPFGESPYHPFQSWALRAGGVFASPIGLLIDPEYGLWHAYRAALIFADRLDISPPTSTENPCLRCEDKPCLSTCPVEAFRPGQFDVASCRSHVRQSAGVVCRDTGCRARLSCPVGTVHAYGTDQQRFHMAAFSGTE